MHFWFVSSKNEKSWIPIGGAYQATDDIFVTVRDQNRMIYEFTILPGFRTDGGSVPWCFRWFAPGWTEDEPLVNLAFAIHDGLYSSELLPRGQADDLLRGLLRDAGWSRLRASTVCYAVNKFAASHYGKDRDPEENRLFFRMRRMMP